MNMKKSCPNKKGGLDNKEREVKARKMTQGVELQPDPVGHTARAIQSAARKAHVLDDVPLAMKRSKVHRPFLVKRAISARGQEKQLEKELPWHAIP